MSHKTEHVGHWEGLEMWLSVTTNSILPKAAEALRHQTQDQLDDNITSIMRQDPSQNYNHKELAKITSSLSHTLIATSQTGRQACRTTPAGADKRTTAHRAAGTWSSGTTGRDRWGGARRRGGDQQAKRDSSSYQPRNAATQRGLRWSCRQATVCREATREGKDWLQGQKQAESRPLKLIWLNQETRSAA